MDDTVTIELSPAATQLTRDILAAQRIDPAAPDAATALALLQEALTALTV